MSIVLYLCIVYIFVCVMARKLLNIVIERISIFLKYLIVANNSIRIYEWNIYECIYTICIRIDIVLTVLYIVWSDAAAVVYKYEQWINLIVMIHYIRFSNIVSHRNPLTEFCPFPYSANELLCIIYVFLNYNLFWCGLTYNYGMNILFLTFVFVIK